jgi:hypothetical protein
MWESLEMTLRFGRYAVALGLLLAFESVATSVVEESIEELSRRSHIVVRGIVGQSQAAWDASQRRIWTWTELKVLDSIKGAPVATILVKQPGGEIGGIGQKVAGVALFSTGEECLVFLEPAVDEPSVYVLRGLSAGKIRFDRTGPTHTAVRSVAELNFARPGPVVISPAPRPVDVLGTPESVIARVRLAVGKGAP